MPLPYFHINQDSFNSDLLTLSDETSRHVVQVLRMKEGDMLHLTNGQGLLLKASITEAHKKKAVVKIVDQQFTVASEKKISIAVSLLKNASRLEWFLEKAAELGVYQIIPLICERTEKMHFRKDRSEQILISAMLQSQQTYLTRLQHPVTVENFFQSDIALGYDYKYLAHCADDEKHALINLVSTEQKHTIIFIGPEGDFTEKEIMLAKKNGYSAVSLGSNRLRTETAALTAAAILCIN
jgi:16S rRNA (uracil1498-N3)-methyltransferase